MDEDQTPPRTQTRAVHSFAARLRQPIDRFLRIEAASGIVLLTAALAALAWANSPWTASHERLFGPLRFFIDDGILTVFFLVAGLEIRRELYDGELSDPKRAALPAVAALGGMIVPALLYLVLNRKADVVRGWGIPTATDLAFAVGVLSLLGRRVPPPLRVFLLALAIIDDVGAVVVIAVGYSRGLWPFGLIVAVVGALAVPLMQRAGVQRPLAYVAPGAIVWLGLWRAGVHPTLAGVVLGLLTPMTSDRDRANAPAVQLATTLHPWVAFGIMPLFALANCAVDLRALTLTEAPSRTVFFGVMLGLAVGKPLGILAACAALVHLGLGALPRGVSWRAILVAGCVAGIGFTMAILVAELSFVPGALLTAAKAAVLASSVVGGGLGVTLGLVLLRSPTATATRSIARDVSE